MKRICKTTPQTKETTLEAIIRRTVNLIMVEQIYQTNRIYRGSNCTELIILISDQCGKVPDELFPVVDMIFEDQPGYCYRLFKAHQVRNSLKRGNLFFYEVCSIENKLYSKPCSVYSLLPEMVDIDEIFVKAKEGFRKEIVKTTAFNEGAKFYFKKQNYALTAFMVHQQIELTYRAIELFAMGKGKVTHSIKVHQKHVAPYLHDLGLLFDETKEDENILMQQLDDAYLAVRYESDYQISEQQLDIAIKKGILAQKIVSRIYNEFLSTLKQKYLPEDNIAKYKGAFTGIGM